MTREWVIAAAWIVGGTVAGVAVETTVIRRLLAMPETNRLHWMRIGAGVLSNVVVIWCALLGAAIGFSAVHGNPRVETLLDRLVNVLFLLSSTWFVARIAGGAVSLYGRRHLDRHMLSASLFSTIAQGAVIVIGLLMVLDSLGIAIAPLLTALGVGGLAVALALRDTLANLFSGIQIVASRQIRPGDYVKLDTGAEGSISDINWRNTTIRDSSESTIIVPNEKLAGSIVTNYSLGGQGTTVAVTTVVEWKGDARALRDLAADAGREASREVAGSSFAEECIARITAVNDANVEVTAFLRIASVDDRTKVRDSFLWRLQTAVRSAPTYA